jgi:glycosyltransferase involved in cell wall biosynthesis
VREIAFVEIASQMSGVEFSTLYLAERLERGAWVPLVVCPEEGDLPARCRAADIPVAIVPRARFFSTSIRIGKFALVNPLALIADAMAILLSARALARFLRARRPALVVPKGLVAQFYAGLAARWAGIPCVWHVQDRVSNRAGPLFSWMLALAGRALARAIIVDAESIARQIVPLVPRARVAVIWNGVDTREFSPQAEGGAHVRAEWGAQPDDVLIGAVGRLTRWKGQHILLRAFAKIADQFPRARVVFVGSPLFDTDAYARALERLVARWGLDRRVIFAGFRWDMPRVFAALDIVAHPALEKDSSPLAVVSAMAAGKAIVCARVDGTAQLFEDDADALLAPPGDADALAARLAQLLDDPALRRRLGDAARVKAERELSVERFARECESVFEKALGI